MSDRRKDAWDAALTDEQRDAIFRKATQGGFAWEAVCNWIAAEYHTKRPSRSAYYNFLDYWRAHYLARRIQERAFARDTIREERAKLGDMSPERVQQLEDAADDLIAAGQHEQAVILYRVAQGIREDLRKQLDLQIRQQNAARADKDLDIKLRRLALIEAKLREAQDTGKTVDPKALADEIDRTLGRKAAGN